MLWFHCPTTAIVSAVTKTMTNTTNISALNNNRPSNATSATTHNQNQQQQPQQHPLGWRVKLYQLNMDRT